MQMWHMLLKNEFDEPGYVEVIMWDKQINKRVENVLHPKKLDRKI